MEHDGFSLDDKRQKVPDNDIPDLQKQIAPLKTDRLLHHATIHRLKFEEVIADGRADNGQASTDGRASWRKPDEA